LFDVRAQAVTEKLENPTLLTKAKRDMARILTVQQQRLSAARAKQQEASAAAGAAKA
jgi:ribosomal protein L29